MTSTLNHLPEVQSKIVFDKFHIAKHLSEAVDQVRRRKGAVWPARATTGCAIPPAWNPMTGRNSPHCETAI